MSLDIDNLIKVKKRNNYWVWTPPANGHIKVNVNGSFLEVSGRGGIESIFRNSDRGRKRFLFNMEKDFYSICEGVGGRFSRSCQSTSIEISYFSGCDIAAVFFPLFLVRV